MVVSSIENVFLLVIVFSGKIRHFPSNPQDFHLFSFICAPLPVKVTKKCGAFE
jgi:hypothetical protein